MSREEWFNAQVAVDGGDEGSSQEIVYRHVELRVLRSNFETQSQVRQLGKCRIAIVDNVALMLRATDELSVDQVKQGCPLRIYAHSTKFKFESDAMPGDNTAMLAAEALYLFGYITHGELWLHKKIAKMNQHHSLDKRNRERALEALDTAVSSLGKRGVLLAALECSSIEEAIQRGYVLDPEDTFVPPACA